MKRPDVNLGLVGALVAVVIGFMVWAPPGLPWEWGSLRPAIDEDVIETLISMRATLDSLGGEDRQALVEQGVERTDVLYCQGAVGAFEEYLLHYAGGYPSPHEKLADILGLGGCASLLQGGHFLGTVNDWWDKYRHSS
jgi:hypothetical protein